MKPMSPRKFGRIVARVIESLPAKWKCYLDNVVVDVEDEADEQTLRDLDFTEEEIAAGESPYGLFVPMNLAPMPDGMDLGEPHRIIIYQRPLEEDFPERRELMREIRRTVIHELAHHFGYTDSDIDRDPTIEDAPWLDEQD